MLSSPGGTFFPDVLGMLLQPEMSHSVLAICYPTPTWMSRVLAGMPGRRFAEVTGRPRICDPRRRGKVRPVEDSQETRSAPGQPEGYCRVLPEVCAEGFLDLAELCTVRVSGVPPTV